MPVLVTESKTVEEPLSNMLKEKNCKFMSLYTNFYILESPITVSYFMLYWILIFLTGKHWIKNSISQKNKQHLLYKDTKFFVDFVDW